MKEIVFGPLAGLLWRSEGLPEGAARSQTQPIAC